MAGLSDLPDFFGKMGATSGAPATPLEFVLQLTSGAVASGLLAWFYARHGRSLADRRAFAANFVPVTVATLFIISVVKSSLALSLGLVGALSIVRFRTAVREPEELIYLFICIALGLGFGAGAWLVSGLSFVALVIVLFLVSLVRRRANGSGSGLFIVIQGPQSPAFDVQSLLQLLAKHVRRSALRRYEVGDGRTEAAFSIEVASSAVLATLVSSVRALDPSARLVLYDHQGKTLE